jgi:mono/diheme cytochrome c family protein
VPVALSTGQEVGLGVVAAIFVGFALVSSFLLPRRDPDFPGPWLRWFVLASIVLFLAMITAVLVFARESEGETHGAAATHEEPAETQTEPGPAPTETAGGGNEGDAEAGAAVFQEGGCGGCHALEAAGASGTVGPNLDESKPDFALVVERVTNGQGVMPAFGDQFDEKQIADVAAYVVESTGGG